MTSGNAHCLYDIAACLWEADHGRASTGDAGVARVQSQLEWLGARAINAQGGLKIREKSASLVDAARL
jgi:hypothetical protein